MYRTTLQSRGKYDRKGEISFSMITDIFHSHLLIPSFSLPLSFFLSFTIPLRVVHTIISYYSTHKSDTVGFFNLRLDATRFKFIRCIELKFHTRARQWLNISIWSSVSCNLFENGTTIV